MRIIALLPLAAAVLSIAGCGSYSNPIYGENGIINDRSQNYEQAQASKRLELPPAIQSRSKAMQDILDVPNAGQTASQRSGDFEVPRPEFFYADAGSGTVNLKRQGDDKILVVDEPIADVWLQLQDFWRFNNVSLAKSAPQEGIIETDWIDVDGQELSFVDSMIKRLTFQDIEGQVSDKLRISVRPVADDYNRTMIAMQHVRVPQEQKDQPVSWADDAADVGYKTDMMFEMLRYLSKSTSNQSSMSMLELRRQQNDQPQMGRDSKGYPALKITVPVDQAWDQITRAIDKTDLDIGTRDQQAGVIYMTYTTSTPVDETEKMGFFEWLHSDRKDITFDTGKVGRALGFDDEEENSGPTYSSKQYGVEDSLDDGQEYSVDDKNDDANRKGFKIWLGGEVLYIFGDDQDGVYNDESGKYEHVGQYQLHMNRTASGAFLTVKTPDGYSAPALVADEILWQIKEKI
ncbi:outer membrane protein assembly factor BamC [Amphritea sp. 1_MG-2023]|uniref:outer membrane protein assembly factor BamC n=1 Tax=Amphritea sp. 1_MG-2023 TaxID=3062670 RepID=UPI0026E3F9D9|nr:outer membrane protein assembly factor BamC [Amphritea sp. 1_MG-2023]MDO6562533.1 outer membrane protein assembly factor BamC [Amphritea sp. 1_MG-2023]